MQDTYCVFAPFGGVGGGALGFQQAHEGWRNIDGQFEVLGGLDSDALACADFEMLTGVAEMQADLFDEADYTAWHSHQPPQDWQPLTLDAIRVAAQGRAPDLLFSSPPCKGLSSLLPQASADSNKYQALNRLVIRGIVLSLEAWREDPPAIILLENVPRITTRGGQLLAQVRAVLESYGYVIHRRADDFHDCGELGGLGQHRRRYLLIARYAKKVPALVYKPPKQRVRSIGEVIGPLPFPDDQACGPMHRLPRLQWKTWVRLALIPAGGDWRNLQDIEAGRYSITQAMNGVHVNKYRVLDMRQPAPTVTGSDRLGSGAPSLADYRLRHKPMGNGQGTGAYRVQRWDGASATVTGDPSHRKSGGAGVVADPRLAGKSPHFNDIYGVSDWGQPGDTVTGGPHPSNGAQSVADPRLTCRPHNGAYRIAPWDEPSSAVTGAGDVHAQGAAAVADPRIPADGERGAWIIVALDNSWHRPLTTWELLALQGFPLWLPGGNPVILAGNSDRRWREAVGNAVPPPAAAAIGRAILRTLMPATRGYFVMGGTGVWVRQPALPAVAQAHAIGAATVRGVEG